MPRIVIDITTLARWQGPPVGIPRCQARYCDYALRTFPDVAFTVFDPASRRFRMLNRGAAADVLAGRTRIDMALLPDPTGRSRRVADRVPAALRGAYLWITRARRKALAALEQLRLGSGLPRLRALAARLQDRLMSPRYRALYRGADGTRIDVPSLDRLAGAPLELGPDDVTVAMQYDWLDTDFGVLDALRREAGSRHVALCHDIIPLQSPHWYKAHDVAGFRAHWEKVLSAADRIVFTSRRTAADVARWCGEAGVALAPHEIVPLGAEMPKLGAAGALPEGLVAGRYALFVSTLEPRKNHALLVEVWRRLVREGLVARTGFRLVFAGRKGWMVGPLLAELEGDLALATIRHVDGPDDATLFALYRDAAFCVYPPKFEGFGLPPIEALAAGKAVIVSSAGPMPEIVGDFAVALDPDDVDAWTARMRDWIDGSDEPRRYGARAAADYVPMSWDESAALFFAAVLRRP